jgi:hypothetical protein
MMQGDIGDEEIAPAAKFNLGSEPRRPRGARSEIRGLQGRHALCRLHFRGCRAWAAIVFASSIQLRLAPTPIGSFTATMSSRGCPCRLWGSIMPAAYFNARPKPNSTQRRLCPSSVRTSRDFHRSSTASPITSGASYPAMCWAGQVPWVVCLERPSEFFRLT